MYKQIIVDLTYSVVTQTQTTLANIQFTSSSQPSPFSVAMKILNRCNEICLPMIYLVIHRAFRYLSSCRNDDW